MTKSDSPVVFVMGVSGVGKSSIASSVSEICDGIFVEADEFHPQENIDAMRRGIALGDEQRSGWLARLVEEIGSQKSRNAGKISFVACSALKRTYRDFLKSTFPASIFVFLSAPKDLIRRRLEARTHHFMPPALLDSQFADLQPPEADEPHILVDASCEPDVIIRSVLAELAAHSILEDVLNTEEKWV